MRGNVLYRDALIVADEEVYRGMVTNKTELSAFIQSEINLFNEKAELSRNLLQQGKLDMKEQAGHRDWMKYCQRIADDLKSGYEFVLPSFLYENKLTMNLADTKNRRQEKFHGTSLA